ncbi:MAG: hypothetical protein QS721_05565 [Candidatus Endonucleobacter sp. (ex Gigantidas childressi)]|nr:hypothetical protein [Candidatus Endonucleobacter sp. (ex Gigantidas childressi)]
MLGKEAEGLLLDMVVKGKKYEASAFAGIACFIDGLLKMFEDDRCASDVVKLYFLKEITMPEYKVKCTGTQLLEG